MNQTAMVMMAGHVVAEPKLGHTRSGQPFTRVRIGVTPRRPDRVTGVWHDIASSYFTVNCWRRMATNATASLRKGDPVIVWGKLRSRSWVDANGQRHQAIDIEADTICHDASMGWTHFLRGMTPGQGADETARRELAAAEEADDLAGDGVPEDPADDGTPEDFAERLAAEGGFTGRGVSDDLAESAVAGVSFAEPGAEGADARDADTEAGDAGDMAASVDEDAFRDGDSLRDGDPFRDGDLIGAAT
jgi:single-strand DNA-binding protein